MKKVVGESLDSLDGYSLVEAPVPEPRPGQVRLRVTDCTRLARRWQVWSTPSATGWRAWHLATG